MSSNFWQETRVQTWRWFIHSKRRPIVVISGLMQPIIWMTLFVIVFKDSMGDVLEGDYLSFVTPGALLFTAFNASLNAGVPILFDRELGFLDRIRSAPLVDRFSIVLASAIHIAVMTMLQCFVIVGATSILGVSFAGGLSGVLLGLLVLSLVILGFTSLSLGLAFMFKRHFEMLAVIMIITLPMIFLSSAFNSLDQLPVWLSNAVLFNPVTMAIEPLRLIYTDANWAMSTVIYDSSFLGALNTWHFLGGLVVFNLLAANFCRKILRKKLA
ncbi:MAG TPA: ABC transporter permease [Planctomycetes bacterium]|jgi:ABC-2 type transport system permease protein|nr:ABC transporter permease [Planctomycetota bacterium]